MKNGYGIKRPRGISEYFYLKDKSKIKYKFFFNYRVTLYGDVYKGKTNWDISKRCLWESEHRDKELFIKEFNDYINDWFRSEHSVEILNIYCRKVGGEHYKGRN